MDVKIAFLNSELNEEVYMEQPEGFILLGNERKVCKLTKSLYGLKQASRKWNEEFTNKMKVFGFEQCDHDHCLFTKGTCMNFIALLVYVDDILVTSASENHIISVKDHLNELCTVKHLGPAKYFLGLELARSAGGLVVTQQKICS